MFFEFIEISHAMGMGMRVKGKCVCDEGMCLPCVCEGDLSRERAKKREREERNLLCVESLFSNGTYHRL